MNSNRNLPRNFSWLLPLKIAGSALPLNEHELRSLKDEGIEAVVTLTSTPLNPEYISKFGFDYLHSHTSGAPSLPQLKIILDYIEEKITESKPVLVHCGEGKGRTGTILAAYLVRNGYTAQDAIQTVREKRPGSIQTPEQESIIKEFECSFKR